MMMAHPPSYNLSPMMMQPNTNQLPPSCSTPPASFPFLPGGVLPTAPHPEVLAKLAHAAETAKRFKTKMCRSFERTGVCRYAHRCMFAHGVDELRTEEANLRDGLVTQDAIFAFQAKSVEPPTQLLPSEPTMPQPRSAVSSSAASTTPAGGPKQHQHQQDTSMAASIVSCVGSGGSSIIGTPPTATTTIATTAKRPTPPPLPSTSPSRLAGGTHSPYQQQQRGSPDAAASSFLGSRTTSDSYDALAAPRGLPSSFAAVATVAAEEEEEEEPAMALAPVAPVVPFVFDGAECSTTNVSVAPQSRRSSGRVPPKRQRPARASASLASGLSTTSSDSSVSSSLLEEEGPRGGGVANEATNADVGRSSPSSSSSSSSSEHKDKPLSPGWMQWVAAMKSTAARKS